MPLDIITPKVCMPQGQPCPWMYDAFECKPLPTAIVPLWCWTRRFDFWLLWRWGTLLARLIRFWTLGLVKHEECGGCTQRAKDLDARGDRCQRMLATGGRYLKKEFL